MSLESIFKLSLIMNMVDHLSGPLAGIASRVGADVAKLDALSQTFGGLMKTGVAMQEMGSQITGALLAPVQATFETRRALGELASLGVEDLGALEGADGCRLLENPLHCPRHIRLKLSYGNRRLIRMIIPGIIAYEIPHSEHSQLLKQLPCLVPDPL